MFPISQSYLSFEWFMPPSEAGTISCSFLFAFCSSEWLPQNSDLEKYLKVLLRSKFFIFNFSHFRVHCASLTYPAKFQSVTRDRSGCIRTVPFEISRRHYLTMFRKFIRRRFQRKWRTTWSPSLFPLIKSPADLFQHLSVEASIKRRYIFLAKKTCDLHSFKCMYLFQLL